MHRWSMRDLERISDKDFILRTLRERRDRCTNPYSPLYDYLTKLMGRIERNEVELFER